MRIGDFLWERKDNGEYVVTYKRTGRSITAIPQQREPNLYFIRESDEVERTKNENLAIPKKYDFWGVMAYCAGRAPSAKVDAPMREVVSDA